MTGPPDRADALRSVEDAGALGVLRRGLAVTPELRSGLRFTALLATATAGGKLAVPVLIQQILDRGVLGDTGYRPGFIAVTCALAAVLVGALYGVSRATFLRLVRAAEAGLFGLRTRTFRHLHRLSLAEHDDQRRGALVARVTSDVDTLAQFTEWGGVAWIVDSVLILATTTVMAVYSWQLTLVAVAILSPLVPLLRLMQRRQLTAYDDVRTAVSGTLSEVSEVVGGMPVIHAYGLRSRARQRLGRAIRHQYERQMRAVKWFAVMFPLSDVFAALALAGVIAVGVFNAEAWGLGAGELVAFVFLVNMLLTPISELSEILDQTQTALAGWRKILGVLALPVELPDPEVGRPLPRGPLAVELERVGFAYRTGGAVLHDVSLQIPAGTSVAVVGETGAGKTTIAKLLCRLADPTTGAVRVGGVDLRDVDAAERHAAIRMVPQDGFLFDATLADNLRVGRPDATDDDLRAVLHRLGLATWLADLPGELEAPLGERGSNLSVGERQLVALARAQLGDPGLLVLDEATSAVDPHTERVLARALEAVARGRTVVSIAHRLSTAERADLVVVVDGGRLVEVGRHADLVAAGGSYAGLYDTWLGNTRERPGAGDVAQGAATP